MIHGKVAVFDEVQKSLWLSGLIYLLADEQTEFLSLRRSLYVEPSRQRKVENFDVTKLSHDYRNNLEVPLSYEGTAFGYLKIFEYKKSELITKSV